MYVTGLNSFQVNLNQTIGKNTIKLGSELFIYQVNKAASNISTGKRKEQTNKVETTNDNEQTQPYFIPSNKATLSK